MALTSLAGQKNLKSLIASEAVSRHSGAYLLAGEDGKGKHSFASEFAKALMCENPGTDGACGKCRPCHYYDALTTPDIVRIDKPDDTKNVKVSDIRERIVAESSVKRQFSRNKVFIINLDYVSVEGQNALLKSIEEPLPDVVYIMIASGTDRILATVRSRVMELKFDRYTEDEVMNILKSKNIEGDDETLRMICAMSSYNPGRAVMMSADDFFIGLNRDVTDFTLRLADDSLTDILCTENTFLADNKQNVDLILEIMIKIFGDMTKYIVYPDLPSKTEYAKKIHKFTVRHRQLSRSGIDRCVTALIDFKKSLEVNSNFDGACCAMMLKISKELKK
ncbi:MAG: hypothetical protein LKG26_04345 [Saccharofermentans sp.]|nr:hypothetical protein [Saccharofermentans sp.]MCI1769678.1 hypothetical protein [Mageeibacillus sp.]MCI2044328.1 hypothetical protein [Mageeibacillus sp.]